MTRTIRVKVGEIVVGGVPARQTAAFRRALEREIRRQIEGGSGRVHAPDSNQAETRAREAAGTLAARLPREARKP